MEVAHQPLKAYGLIYVPPVLTFIFQPSAHSARLC